MAKLLNTHYTTGNDNLIYDDGLPVEIANITVSQTAAEAAGEIVKGQVIDVDFDDETAEATYSVHAADGVVNCIVAETEGYDVGAEEVPVTVITSGNLKADKIVTDVDLTDADLDALRKVNIVLK